MSSNCYLSLLGLPDLISRFRSRCLAKKGGGGGSFVHLDNFVTTVLSVRVRVCRTSTELLANVVQRSF